MQNGINILLSSIGWVLAFIGSLILCLGGLAAYIFKRHAADNDLQFKHNREDHKRIFDILEKRK